MELTIVAGARPNFMKIAPIIKAIENLPRNREKIIYRLVHTGQHYDKAMSGAFFTDLCIPEPNINLEAGGGSQAQQTAAIMVGFEKELIENRPDVVIVVGDVTSTMACTITAKKLCIPVAHVEAGIRSGDMTMPEEVNRMITDSVSDYFFTTTEIANNNLIRMGVLQQNIYFVGNTMIDTLIQNLDKFKKPIVWVKSELQQEKYFILTLHRPSNVDYVEKLKAILECIILSTGDQKIIFPVHPRTKKMLDGIQISHPRLIMVDPLGYHEFGYLVKNSKGVITDSGGITEEATFLKIPCLTLRNSTERPETVSIGSNELVGDDLEMLEVYLKKILAGKWKKSTNPPLWDGNSGTRIISRLLSIYEDKEKSLKRLLVVDKLLA